MHTHPRSGDTIRAVEASSYAAAHVLNRQYWQQDAIDCATRQRAVRRQNPVEGTTANPARQLAPWLTTALSSVRRAMRRHRVVDPRVAG